MSDLSGYRNQVARWIATNPEATADECARRFGVDRELITQLIKTDTFLAAFQAHLLAESCEGRGNPVCGGCGGRMTRVAYGLPDFSYLSDVLQDLRIRAEDYELAGCAINFDRLWICKTCGAERGDA